MSRTVQTGPAGFVNLVRKTTSFDFQPFTTPAALLADATLVVRGNVVGVADGRVGGDPENYSIAIQVRPTEFWKGSPAESADDDIYLEIARPENVAPSRYSELLPAGTDIVIFAYDATNAILEPVVDDQRGRPPGAPIYSPSPQGFFLVASGKIESVWSDESDSTSNAWQLDSISDLKAAATGSQ